MTLWAMMIVLDVPARFTMALMLTPGEVGPVT
jgi:hypothetical protein